MEPTHADIYQQIGRLQADMANVKGDVRDGRLENKEQFTAINTRLEMLTQERQEREGVRKFAAALHAAGGGVFVLAAQWAIKKFGG